MALPLPTSLSPSKVSSFTSCALAFKYSVIDKLYEAPTLATAKGTIVHRALEMLHHAPPTERTIPTGLDALARALPEVLGGEEYGDLDLSDDEAARLRVDCDGLVRNYFELEDPRSVRAVGLEVMLSAQLGGVTMRGIIDRLDLTHDGELIVVDYKTGRVPSERFEAGRLGGVHFYAMLCESLLGRRPTQVRLMYLAEPVTIVAEPSDQSIRGLNRKLGAIWSAIERSCEREDFRPKPSALCSWCSFQEQCPAFATPPLAAAG